MGLGSADNITTMVGTILMNFGGTEAAGAWASLNFLAHFAGGGDLTSRGSFGFGDTHDISILG